MVDEANGSTSHGLGGDPKFAEPKRYSFQNWLEKCRNRPSLGGKPQ